MIIITFGLPNSVSFSSLMVKKIKILIDFELKFEFVFGFTGEDERKKTLCDDFTTFLLPE